MANVRLEHVKKLYKGNVLAVNDFNLEIQDKEFVTFVGPSGCGKSTTLRMIAGLEDISSGKIYIDGTLVNYLEPKNRDIAMVFQSYALYPNMSVYDNMAFSLKMHHLKNSEVDARVREAAKILEIEEYLPRKPKALSGGQRQRVAIGRAIVRKPKVFLMDEPLSNLDAKLRLQMRQEIIRIHKELNSTTIYVTHDQTEAMTMSDRIVVMKKGVIQQVGAPKEVYDHPANVFVAGFIGTPSINLIDSVYKDGKIHIMGKEINLLPKQIEKLKEFEGKEVIVGIRPETISFDSNGIFGANIDIIELVGSEKICYFKIDGIDLIAKVKNHVIVKEDEINHFNINLQALHIFEKESERAIF